MGWILGAAALVVLCVLVLRFERARQAIVVAAMVLALAGLTIWGAHAYRERKALGHLGAEDVELRIFTRDAGTHYAGRPVVNAYGRLFNKSERYEITRFGVHMVLEDCAESPEDGTGSAEPCVTVADEIVDIAVRIPPRQARDFTADIRFAMVMPKGELRWRAAGVPYVRAEEYEQ